jgi:ATP-dependent Clp protease ATP-binding subunit ClpB
VGYEEGGYLTEAVRRRPYCVVLFDEIEKAHPEVFNALLQILDDGRMTDGQGRTVDFKNAIIIMTSNVGSHWIQELGTTRRTEMEHKVTEVLRSTFNPEFLNRIDETIIFDNLSPEQIGQIVDIQIKRLGNRLADLNIVLELSDEARALIADAGFDPVYGARPLKRVIQQQIENPLSMEILSGNVLEGTHLRAEVDKEKIVFKAVAP